MFETSVELGSPDCVSVPLAQSDGVLATLAGPDDVSAMLAQLTDAVDSLLALDLSRLAQDEVLELLRGLEQQRRRLPVVDHALVAELDRRGSAGQMGARDTRTLLREVLRVSPSEAKARCAAAIDLGPRRTVTGEALGPIFPAVAAAQAEGVISSAHAKLIRDTIDALPVEVALEHATGVEERLVAEARRFDPMVLATLAQRLVACLDPDGVLADDAEHDRRRHAVLAVKRDGSGRLEAYLTPAVLAQWQAALDPLAAPRPSDESGPDPRSPGQRLHDALGDVATRLLDSGQLPAAGGVPATVLLTMTLDQLEARTGLVTTAHGGTITVPEALRLAGQAHVIPVVVDHHGVLAYGHSRRVATSGQRLALAARDKSCSFPGCDVPPSWCQAHHVIEWADGGATDLGNLCLVCPYHHREFRRRGWQVHIRDGHPEWTPPPRIDPQQQPIRNTINDPIPLPV